ncbi:MAG TPA: hypothetical protein VM261_20540 [Kofleriaceae bacterium]|nr:hypothetical protein [Kofleriaceae bacterium]
MRSIGVLALSALVLAGAPACEKLGKKNDTVEIAVNPAALRRLEERVEKVMAEPEIQKAMDEMFSAVAADPALGKLAGDLADQLMADPVIATSVQELIGQLGESPALIAYMMNYMQTHPGATADQAGEAFGAEVERKFDVLLMKPVEEEVGHLIERAEGGAGLASLQQHLSGQFGRVIDAYFEAPDRKQRWSKRLTELNGGTKPDPNKAADLYIDTAWSEERMRKFLLRALANPEVRHAVVGALRHVLGDPALRAHLVRATRTLAGDAGLRTAAIDMFMLVLAPDPTPAMAQQKVRALFAAPSVLVAVNDLGQNLLGEKALHEILDGALRETAKEPSVRDALDELCDGW